MCIHTTVHMFELSTNYIYLIYNQQNTEKTKHWMCNVYFIDIIIYTVFDTITSVNKSTIIKVVHRIFAGFYVISLRFINIILLIYKLFLLH